MNPPDLPKTETEKLAKTARGCLILYGSLVAVVLGFMLLMMLLIGGTCAVAISEAEKKKQQQRALPSLRN